MATVLRVSHTPNHSTYPVVARDGRESQAFYQPRQTQAEQDVKRVRADRVADAHRAVALVGDDDAGHGLRHAGARRQERQPHHRVGDVDGVT